jgi:hypothetical protein
LTIEVLIMPPPRSSTSGIKKQSKGKPNRDSGLEQIELAVNNGKFYPEKDAMAADQAVVSDASSPHEHDDAGREGQSSSHASDQSSSTAQEVLPYPL